MSHESTAIEVCSDRSLYGSKKVDCKINKSTENYENLIITVRGDCLK